MHSLRITSFKSGVSDDLRQLEAQRLLRLRDNAIQYGTWKIMRESGLAPIQAWDAKSEQRTCPFCSIQGCLLLCEVSHMLY